MAERPLVFPQEAVSSADALRGWKAAQVAMGWLAEAIIGTGTYVDGLACAPGTGLTVSVAAGQIYTLAETDPTSYSTLGTDTHNVVKQGLVLDPTVLNCPAPGTAGQSINYLVEAQFQENDVGSTLLQYFNSADPTVPYSGPANDGINQNTIRRGVCALQINAGTAATTGTQTTPTADSGWTGLYVVTIAHGATGVVTGNIVQLATAPFINPKLTAVVAAIQGGAMSYATDTGSVNAIAISLNPAPAALTPGMEVRIEIGHTNTGATTLNVNGGGPVGVIAAGAALTAGMLNTNQLSVFIYDGLFWELQSQTAAFALVAAKLQTARTIALGGDLSGSATFDGSANITISATVGAGTITGAKTAAGTIANSNLANMTPGTVKMNNTGGSAAPQDVSNATALLAMFASWGTRSLANPGHMSIPIGTLGATVLLQWGITTVIGAGAGGATTFPLAFPNAAFTINATYENLGSAVPSNGSPYMISALSQTGFSVQNGGAAGSQYNWWAVGN